MAPNRRTFLKGATVASVAGLAGCTGSQNQQDAESQSTSSASQNGTVGNVQQQTKIRFGMGNIPGSGAQREMIMKVQELVNKKADNIDFEIYEITGDTDQATQKLKAQLSSKKSDPDIFNLDSIYVQQFAAADWLEPIGNHIDKSVIDRFADAGVSAGTWNGKLHAAPQFMSAGLMYWNKSHLEQAGLDPETPPKTPTELASKSQKVLQETDVENGFVWQGKQYEGLVCDWLEWVHGRGGWVFGGAENLHATPGDRPVTIDSEEVIQGTRDMRKFIYDSKISPKSVLSMSEGSSSRVFMQGNAAFHRNWFYLPPILQNDEKSKIVDEWGMAPVPGGHGTLGNETYGINPYSKNPKAAAEVVKLLSLDKEINIEKMKVGRIPPANEYWTDSDFKEIEPLGPYLGTYADVLEESIERPATPLYQTESQQVFQTFVSGVLNQKYSAEEGMKKAAKKLKQIENDYEGPK